MSKRQVVALLTTARVEAAHYVQELTYLVVSCQEEGELALLFRADHVLLAMSYTSTGVAEDDAARDKHLAIEGT